MTDKPLNAAETRAAQPQTLQKFRQRVYACQRVEGYDHSTACTIWGDDGQGHTPEGYPEPLPCNCGALINWERKKGEIAAAKASAQPGDAPKLMYEDFWGSLHLDHYGYIITAETVDALNALLASRSTPAAPAPASTEAPGAPSDLYADGFRKGVETLESIIKASLPTFDSNRVAATLEPALVKAAPSTEALIAAGDALRKMAAEWHARAIKNDAAYNGEWASCYNKCAYELEAAIAALHPASEG